MVLNTFFMFNSYEHQIFILHKYKKIGAMGWSVFCDHGISWSYMNYNFEILFHICPGNAMITENSSSHVTRKCHDHRT